VSNPKMISGDWICRDCANELGLDAGREGHEYEAEEDVGGTKSKSYFDDSDEDDEIPRISKPKMTKRKIIHTPESDSDYE
jgi:hypothetical protein